MKVKKAVAPKKTGKRGIGPALDPVKDFETPVKVEKGSSLLVEQPPKPVVMGSRFQAFFRAATFSQNEKTNTRFVHFHMTIELNKEHDALLPKLVAKAHQRVVREKGLAGEKLRDIPAQNFGFFLGHDTKENMCDIKAAGFEVGRIDLIQKKGEGTARKIVRLVFVIKSKHTDDICYFASHNFNNTFWITMEETQADLLDLEDEEE